MKGNVDAIIHTRCAYHNWRDEGAYAYILCDGEDREKIRGVKKIANETSNRAELMAIIAAMRLIPDGAKRVRVYCASQYAIGVLSGGYSLRVNKDLFEEYERIVKQTGVSVKLHWVGADSGNEYSDICRQMCDGELKMDYATFCKSKPYKSWK